ncbi:GntR family transcriptional regulator [Longimicrobium sp.]|jgi:DNA-binding transcriptional regulator YhcF (GntR family)|uniref:GntR family transcriptional regulator n=1 Tax=Longimicrobium sp. TaxID=2029185 RepID=UPI002ED9AB3F
MLNGGSAPIVQEALGEGDVAAVLRDRIVSGLHRGRLRSGERLPSLREVAEELGTDYRTASTAYRKLEEEGLVEVRGRSGVYVAEQERIGGLLLSESAQWLAGVMAGAWKRQIMVPGLPELIHRCMDASWMRCVFVESTEDHLVAFCAELEPAFGLRCIPLYVAPSAGGDGSVVSDQERERLRQELAGAHLVLTTSFHSAMVHGLTESTQTPMVVLKVGHELATAIRRQLRRGSLTVVCTDPRFGERVRYVYGGDQRDAIRVVRADDPWAVAQLDPDEPVLLTRAARRRLMDDVHLRLLTPHSPTLSFESARELSAALIRLNMERAGEGAAVA